MHRGVPCTFCSSSIRKTRTSFPLQRENRRKGSIYVTICTMYKGSFRLLGHFDNLTPYFGTELGFLSAIATGGMLPVTTVGQNYDAKILFHMSTRPVLF